MEPCHDIVRRAVCQATTHQACGYEVDLLSSQEPCIPKYHKMYFVARSNLPAHTNQNHIFSRHFYRQQADFLASGLYG